MIVVTELNDLTYGNYDDKEEELEELKFFPNQANSLLFGNPTPGGPPSIG